MKMLHGNCMLYKYCFYLSNMVITIGGSRSIGAGRIILVNAVSFNALQHIQATVTVAQKIQHSSLWKCCHRNQNADRWLYTKCKKHASCMLHATTEDIIGGLQW